MAPVFQGNSVMLSALVGPTRPHHFPLDIKDYNKTSKWPSVAAAVFKFFEIQS